MSAVGSMGVQVCPDDGPPWPCGAKRSAGRRAGVWGPSGGVVGRGEGVGRQCIGGCRGGRAEAKQATVQCDARASVTSLWAIAVAGKPTGGGCPPLQRRPRAAPAKHSASTAAREWHAAGQRAHQIFQKDFGLLPAMTRELVRRGQAKSHTSDLLPPDSLHGIGLTAYCLPSPACRCGGAEVALCGTSSMSFATLCSSSWPCGVRNLLGMHMRA